MNHVTSDVLFSFVGSAFTTALAGNDVGTVRAREASNSLAGGYLEDGAFFYDIAYCATFSYEMTL